MLRIQVRSLNESVGLLECIEKVEKALYERAGLKPFESIQNPEKPEIRKAHGVLQLHTKTLV